MFVKGTALAGMRSLDQCKTSPPGILPAQVSPNTNVQSYHSIQYGSGKGEKITRSSKGARQGHGARGRPATWRRGSPGHTGACFRFTHDMRIHATLVTSTCAHPHLRFRRPSLPPRRPPPSRPPSPRPPPSPPPRRPEGRVGGIGSTVRAECVRSV